MLLMALQPELLETIDTAVKIGLGAAITGLFTIAHSIASARTERTKELHRRRQDGAEQVARDFEPTYVRLVFFLQDLRGLLPATRTRSPTQAELEKFQVETAAMREYVSAMSAVRGRLLLLGLADAEQCLETLCKGVTAFASAIGASMRAGTEVEQVEKEWQSIRGARVDFYRLLSKAYCQT
jgi:hypothetical protein